MDRITEYCTGCRTCEQICPKRSICFVPDEEGFLSSIINHQTCIDCGLCQKHCPQNRTNLQNATSHSVYAARLKDEKTLFKSASGGAFAGFAIKVIEQGGVVFGVRYDENLRAIHAKAETIEDLQPLFSSKYVQSDTGHSYSGVKRCLEEGRFVLYSGTGCQIAGLKAFLKKDYDNLLLVDLVCHGVTSPLLFSKYLELLQLKHGARIEEYDFRDKSGGWGLGYKYKYKYKYKYGSCTLDPYYTAFLEGYAYRECCYRCKYANTERPGDITIADYWGVERFHPDFYSHKGVSLIMLNSKKGDKFWNEVTNDFQWIESKLEYAIVQNENLRKPTTRTPVRDHVYEGINSLTADDYFTKNLPLNPTFISRVKALLPMHVILILKKFIWRIHRYK